MISKLLLSIIFLLIFCRCICQEKKNTDFNLEYLSNDISCPVAKLKAQIGKAKSLDDVKMLIRKTIRDTTGTVTISFKRDNTVYLWTRNIGKKQEEETGLIILGKRGISSKNIHSPKDFRQVLQDTVCIADSLSLTLFLNYTGLDNKAYYFLYTNRHDSLQPTPLLPCADSNCITVFQSLFAGADSTQAIGVSLKNKEDEHVIASCYLHFLTLDQKEQIYVAANIIKRVYPRSGKQKQADILDSYITQTYGSIFFDDAYSLMFGKSGNNR